MTDSVFRQNSRPGKSMGAAPQPRAEIRLRPAISGTIHAPSRRTKVAKPTQTRGTDREPVQIRTASAPSAREKIAPEKPAKGDFPSENRDPNRAFRRFAAPARRPAKEGAIKYIPSRRKNGNPPSAQHFGQAFAPVSGPFRPATGRRRPSRGGLATGVARAAPTAAAGGTQSKTNPEPQETVREY